MARGRGEDVTTYRRPLRRAAACLNGLGNNKPTAERANDAIVATRRRPVGMRVRAPTVIRSMLTICSISGRMLIASAVTGLKTCVLGWHTRRPLCARVRRPRSYQPSCMAGAARRTESRFALYSIFTFFERASTASKNPVCAASRNATIRLTGGGGKRVNDSADKRR